MIYVLAYPRFEERLAAMIARFRAAHEPERAELVPPHVTLVFGSDPANRESISAACHAVADRTPELDVEFGGFEVSYDPFERRHKLMLI